MLFVWQIQNLFQKFYVIPRYGSKDDGLKKVLRGDPKNMEYEMCRTESDIDDADEILPSDESD